MDNLRSVAANIGCRLDPATVDRIVGGQRVPQRDAISVITEFEHGLHLREESPETLQLWPLIRIQLWNRLVHGKKAQTASLSPPPSKRKLAQQAIHDLRLRASSALGQREVQDQDAWITAYQSIDAWETVKGRYDKRHDPLMTALDNLGYRGAKVTLSFLVGESASNELTNPNFLVPVPSCGISRRIRHRGDRLWGCPCWVKLECWVRRINETIGTKVVSSSGPATQWLQAEAMTAFLDSIRTRLPRVIFMTYYADSRNLALIAAARRLGITTVDVQHGKQGSSHGLYTHWNIMPETGFDCLPDVFWTWGKSSSDSISKGLHPESPHRTVVGGKPEFVAFKEDGLEQFLSQLDRQWLEELGSFERVVLFSGQHDGEVPEKFLKAMAACNRRTAWLIRAHPIISAANTDEMLRAASRHVPDDHYLDVDVTTRLPLPLLFRYVTHHVTLWSSVAVDARSFGIPTAMLGTMAPKIFEEDIAVGLVAHFHESESLRSWIEAAPVPPRESHPFVRSDKGCLEAAIKSCFQGI